MTAFKFDEKKAELLKLDINGVKFAFNPRTIEVQEVIREFVNRHNLILTKMQDKGVTEEELNEQTYRACIVVKDTINKMLGKRSYERIFKNRTADYDEHMKLAEFLFKEIKDFSSEYSNRQTTH